MRRFFKIEIALAILVIMMAVFIVLREPAITGVVILKQKQSFSKDINLTFDANGNYLLEFNQTVKLKSLTITGSVFGEGKVSVLLDNQYSVYNNQEAPISITGLVVEGEIANNSNNDSIDNETVEQDEEEISKSITVSFSYIDNNFDPDNDGITHIEDAVDFQVDISANFDYNEENLCTRFEIYSEDNEESTFVCQGNTNCCNFVDLAPFNKEWNAPYYSYYLKDGASFNNIISAQVIHYDISLRDVISADVLSSDSVQLIYCPDVSFIPSCDQ